MAELQRKGELFGRTTQRVRLARSTLVDQYDVVMQTNLRKHSSDWDASFRGGLPGTPDEDQ